MERGSVHHGARIDEEMAEEVDSLTRGAPLESRSREVREQEPPANHEPTPDALISGSIEQQAVELRSEIARHLRPAAFPADAEELERVARTEQAPDHVLAVLGRLPAGRTFATVGDVWVAIGGTNEARTRASDTAAAVPTEAPPEPETTPPETEPETEPEETGKPEESRSEPAAEHEPSALDLVRGIAAAGLEVTAVVLDAVARRVRPRHERPSR